MEYDITATILADYNRNTVLNVLQKGSDMGLSYFDFIFGERYIDSRIIDIYTATEKVINPQFEFPWVYAGIDKTYFHISFVSEKAGSLQIMLFAFAYQWDKYYPIYHKQDIDFNRYAYLLLKLIEKFKIISFILNAD